MALLEGMGFGLPVVATAVGEVPQVVVDGTTGLLVPPDSPSELAGAMRRLLSHQELRETFGEAGRLRVAEHFSAERMSTATCTGRLCPACQAAKPYLPRPNLHEI